MPRSPTPTRDRIRAAAETLFRERGYADASVRDIALSAEADPALVIRHFGSKELLFLESMRVPLQGDPLLDVPLEELGPRFVAALLGPDEGLRGAWLALVRGSQRPSIAERLLAVHSDAFVAPLRARLAGEDADLRARLAAALVGGLLYSMWVVRDEALLAADRAEVVDRYGALLLRLITPDH